jgi:DNA polymerase III subunit gamma/tau
MAQQALYRKWRSQTFSDLKGQDAISQTLLNAVREGRIAHAYLFCGPRGTGKTSSARLLAKAVNCERPINGEPCNQCLSCVEINEGRSPDVIEIDAASNTSVDNIRELRNNANLMSVGGRYKVYILDEAHMLSGAAFNALLKILEEPPGHVIFVLATTEAHKMMATIISRCQRFDFRRFTMADTVARLRHVAAGEGLTLEPGAVELLARAAQGGMRDALSLLDQAITYSGQTITAEAVLRMLGLSDPGKLRGLLEAIAEGHAADALHTLNVLIEDGADTRQLHGQLADEWRALMLARAGADLTVVMERTADEAAAAKSLAERFSPEELLACARAFARQDGNARSLPVPQMALELLILECLAIRRGAPTMAQPMPPIALTSLTQPSAPHPEPRREPPAHLREVRAEPRAAQSEPPSHVAHQTPSREPAPLPGPSRQTMPATPPDLAHLLEQAQREWLNVRRVCKTRSPSVSALLVSAKPVMVEPDDPPVLVLQASYDFHLQKLKTPQSREAVEWAIAQVLETPVRLRVIAASGASQPARAGRGARQGLAAQEPPVTRRDAPPPASNGHSEGPPPAKVAAKKAPASIEEEAVADPVVREILRQGKMEVVKVQPIEATADDDD